MNCRRQALQLCLDAAVVVVIQIFNEFLFEMFHGLKFLQICQLAFEQPKEIFYHSIVQTVPLATHALPDAFLAEHPLILLMLVLPALIGMKNQVCSVRNLCKRLVQHTPKNYELLIRNTPPEISRQLRKCYSTVLAYKADR